MAQTPDPDGNQDGQRDLDAEFAALMDDVEIPDDLSAVDDLEAPEGTRSGQDRDGSNEDGPASVADPGQAGPQGVSPHDVPHNTYHPLSEADGGVQAPDGSSRLTDAQEAQIAAAADSLSSYGSGESGDQAPRAVKVAVVMTPLNRADGLAGMCSLLDLDCTAVLMTADLATDVGIESGLSGTITARHFTNGQPGEEASAGLLLASMDQVVEDVLLGVIDADDVPGAVRSSEIKAPRAMRWFGRGLRRPPQ